MDVLKAWLKEMFFETVFPWQGRTATLSFHGTKGHTGRENALLKNHFKASRVFLEHLHCSYLIDLCFVGVCE